MTINDDMSWLANSQLSALTRRGFIGIGSASAAGLLLASCTPGDGTGGDSTGGGNGGGTDLREAPDLTKLAEAGDIPPLAERLPNNPLVINTVERAGVYGGTWHTVTNPNDTGWMLQRVTGHTYLVRWDPDFNELIEDAAEEFSMNDDATEATFKLREGIKWSDGEPFTAADVVFAVNDIQGNSEITPNQTMQRVAEAVGDYEVVIRLNPANGLYLQQQAGPGRTLTACPKHYLEQFHKDYNDDVEDLVKQEGAQDWVELIENKGVTEAGRLSNPDLPVLSPWVLTQAAGASGTKVVFSRNPYFWKVDQDGRQLPYIDQVEFNIVGDPEVMVTAASNGEVDMSNRTFNIPRNKPVLAEHRESGDYDFIDMPPTFMNTTVVAFNQTIKDSKRRELYRNKDFRIAVSHAINRQEIIDVVFQRQGEPWQAAPRADSKFYDEEFAKQYTEHDVALAKEHLAKAGVEAGEVTATLMVSNFKPEWVDVAPLLVGHLAEIGITLKIDAVDNTLFNERITANDYDLAIWQGDGGGNDLFQDPRWYFPFNVTNSQFGPLWAEWYVTGGAQGEEPLEPGRKQIELYHEIESTGDPARQDELMKEILQISKEQFYAIGIHLPGDGYGIVKNNFHNVPKVMIDSYYWSGPGPVNPEQFFIED